jgi:glycosyltransferase involved in cell wall biosynthesis
MIVMENKISVIIPLYNDEKNISLVLQGLLEQSSAPHEVVVVDNGSTDLGKEAVRGFIKRFPANVLMLEEEKERGPGMARNRGIRCSSGDIIAFLDSDCIPERKWIESIDAFFISRPNFDAVGGIYYAYQCETILDHFMNKFWIADPITQPEQQIKDDKDIYIGRHIITYNCAFRKEAVEKIGFFDPLFRFAGEDIDYVFRTLRSRRKICYSYKEMVVFHNFRKHSFKSILFKQSNYAQGWIDLLKRYSRKKLRIILSSRFNLCFSFPATVFVSKYTPYLLLILILLFLRNGLLVLLILHAAEMFLQAVAIRKHSLVKNLPINFGKAMLVYLMWAARRLTAIPARIYCSLKNGIYYL